MRYVAVVSLWIALALSGTIPSSWAGDKPVRVSDEWCGFSLSIAKSWVREGLHGSVALPGTVRCAWSRGDSSFVVYVQETEAEDPRKMLDWRVAEAKRFADKILAQEVRTIAGMRAMWVIAQGKGRGRTIDGRGDKQIVQHWVAVPRENDVVILLLTCPAPEYEESEKTFAAAVASLTLSGSQTKQQ